MRSIRSDVICNTKIVRTVVRSAVAVALLVVAPTVASSQAITFTQTGVSGSGLIGTAAFSQRSFTITSTGDVASRQTISNGYFIDHLTASISIDGVGSFDVTSGTRTFVSNTTGVAGFSRAGAFGEDLYSGPFNDAFNTWDMTTSIGSFSGNAVLGQWFSPSVETTGGVLNFDSGATTGTFAAVVGLTTTVPEPSTYLLMATGLLTLGVLARRRRKI